ncbi:MAG: CBS domain-containing protein [Gammaproteobacteria bacterium]|nr:CBS domain-containing protein [Gammaproteobacteria bacterium]MBU0788295.1 CBS domain-containing protein [Gammaproteobacteria bacterium]MBU0815208.1 CBS domain-containing protein [Gammaproteobacteria bacterium]MBU1785684.1 CBS domain-containing protein [Gammaproteobacteria bacterium]
MQLDIFLIPETASLREALQRIEANHHGVIFVAALNGAVTGVATDGDIRRHLLDGGSLDDAVALFANRDFVWEKPSTPRELLLKKLDHSVRVIPLLDEARCLVDLITRDHMPVQAEGAVYARARAPVRISFGGGGSDSTHYFSAREGGAVINTTISLYSHATLRVRDDSQVIISSLDIGESLKMENLRAALAQPSRFGLVQALLRAINPDFGFELFLHSDFPMSSGLGGSAVISASILGCFNQFRRDQWDLHELAEIAYQAERHYLGVAGGWQDQYATVFGGFNFMEFRMDQNIVHPLRIQPDTLLELEECLILCDTGMTHDSGNIHQDQRQQMAAAHVRDIVESNVRLSYGMRNDLLRGRLLQFGQALDKAWEFKRQFSDKISSSRLDQIYENAKSHGAIGGKLLGAGGGGFFLFYAHPYGKHQLITHLEASGLKIRPFRFEPRGLQAWTVRECRNHYESAIQ